MRLIGVDQSIAWRAPSKREKEFKYPVLNSLGTGATAILLASPFLKKLARVTLEIEGLAFVQSGTAAQVQSDVYCCMPAAPSPCCPSCLAARVAPNS